MGEHMVLSVDPLVIIAPAHVSDEEERNDPIQMIECRICQEEDTLQNLDTPCACSGTLKFAHTKCVQLWCYEKGDTICEICHQPFKPGYSATSPFYHPENATIDIREDWSTSRNPLDWDDPRLLAIAAVEHQVMEAGDEDYVHTGISGTTLCRFAALIVNFHSVRVYFLYHLLQLMALLFLRHASFFNADVEKALAYFSFFFLRAAAVILPFYLIVQIIRMIQHQRQRQEAAAHLAYMLQAEERG